MYLNVNDFLYHNITTDVSDILSDLISFLDECIDFSVKTYPEESKRQDFEEGSNPFDSSGKRLMSR